jgi:hypothetical protein
MAEEENLFLRNNQQLGVEDKLELTCLVARFSSAEGSGFLGAATSGTSLAAFLVFAFADFGAARSLVDFGVAVPLVVLGVFSLIVGRGFLTDSGCAAL